MCSKTALSCAPFSRDALTRLLWPVATFPEFPEMTNDFLMQKCRGFAAVTKAD